MFSLSGFMQAGGEVLYPIAVLLFILWVLILERFSFILFSLKGQKQSVVAEWEGRSDRSSWSAKMIRQQLISQLHLSIRQNTAMINSLIALCPLFGLLGTVWGMIEVFSIMSLTGGGDVKAMAGGVSKATIPTMAGMVAALSGVFANAFLSRIVEREVALVEDSLVMGEA